VAAGLGDHTLAGLTSMLPEATSTRRTKDGIAVARDGRFTDATDALVRALTHKKTAQRVSRKPKTQPTFTLISPPEMRLQVSPLIPFGN
jgi:hypothetical protein